MAVFSNPFFSVAGQKERLKNVVDVLKIAVNPLRKDKIQANTSSKIADKALEAVANNPYTTAGIAILPTSAGKQAVSAVSSKIATSFSQAKLTTQVGIISGGIVSASILATSKKARSTIKNPIPELAEFGADIGGFIEDSSLQNAQQIISNSPIISALVGTAVVGGAISKIAPAVTGFRQVEAIQDLTESIDNAISYNPGLPQNMQGTSNILPDVKGTTATNENTNVYETAKQINTTKKRRRTAKKSQNINISMVLRDYGCANR